MSNDQISPRGEQAEEVAPSGGIRARSALRLVLVLLAIWTGFSGLTLVFFQDAAAATIGGGLEGGEGEAAQRLLGVHLLVLAPIYGLLAWEPRRFGLLLWVPYVAQGGVVAVTAFDIITLDRDFLDGALPLIVAATFFTLLVYVWLEGRRQRAVEEVGYEAESAEGELEETEPT